MTSPDERRAALTSLREAVVVAQDRALNLTVALDRARDLTRGLDRARDLTRDLARDLDCDLTRDLARDLDRTRDRTRDLDRDLDRDLALALALALTGDRNLFLFLAVARDRARDRDLVSARDLHSRLVSATAQIDRMLGATGVSSSAPSGTSTRRAPAVAAVRVLNRLVRVLPGPARARYQEELHCELVDLAAEGASRWAQLVYTLKLAINVWSLRRAALAATGRERVR